MNTRAIDANEDSVGNTCPGWILRLAIETNLIGSGRPKSFEDLCDVIFSWSVGHGEIKIGISDMSFYIIF